METHNQYYDLSSTAIKDHSMLGAHGEELCNNLDVHWMTQTCGAGKNETETGMFFMFVLCVMVQQQVIWGSIGQWTLIFLTVQLSIGLHQPGFDS